jgi:hypothetical protein
VISPRSDLSFSCYVASTGQVLVTADSVFNADDDARMPMHQHIEILQESVQLDRKCASRTRCPETWTPRHSPVICPDASVHLSARQENVHSLLTACTFMTRLARLEVSARPVGGYLASILM